MRRRIFSILLVVMLFMGVLPLFNSTAKAMVVNPGTFFVVGNENYSVSRSMTFSQVSINSSWICFNNTGFNVSAPNSIWFGLSYLHPSPGSVANGTRLLTFNASTSGGSVQFNLSGFHSGFYYDVKRNGTSIGTICANATFGNIYFIGSVWSMKNISIWSSSGASAPVVTTNASTNVEETTATLNGYVNGSGVTSYGFEWGLNLTYDHQISFNVTGAGGGPYVDSVSRNSVIWHNATFNLSYPQMHYIDPVDKRAYVCSYADGTLMILNVSDPSTAPTLLGKYIAGTDLDGIHDVFYKNYSANKKICFVTTHALFPSKSYVISLNVTDPSSIVLMDKIYIGYKGMYLAYDNVSGCLFVSTGHHWNISIINITDPSDLNYGANNITSIALQPWHMSFFTAPNGSRFMYVTGALGVGISQTYDVTNLGGILYKGAVNASGYYDRILNYSWNGFEYLIGSSNLIHKIDVYNVSSGDYISPTWMYAYGGGNVSGAMVVRNGYVFISRDTPYTGISIYNLTDINNPSFFGGVYEFGGSSSNLSGIHEIEFGNESYVYMQGYTVNTFITLKVDWIYLYGSYAPPHFSYGVSGLSPGTLYHYRAFANNSNGTGYGSDVTFLTKPNEPTGLDATPVSPTVMSLSWTKGSGANNTLVRRKVGGYPTSITDGTFIYNGTANSYISTNSSAGAYYYYRAWSFSIWDSLSRWSDSYAGTTALSYPGNVSGFTASSASSSTINLAWTKGSGSNNTRIQYSTTGYPTTISSGANAYNDTSNSYIHPGLSPGNRYYYSTWAFAKYGSLSLWSMGYVTGVNVSRPGNVTNLVVQSNSTNSQYLSWTPGSGANYTRVQRKTGGYPTGIADGTNVYNGTGSHCESTGLGIATVYYYRAWSFSIWGSIGSWSTGYASGVEITKPEGPHHGNVTLLNATHIRLNWTKGTGANNTVVIRKLGSYPSSVFDGTSIYNGTGISVDVLFDPLFSYLYRAWSYAYYITPGVSEYSSNYTNVTYGISGGLFVNCYDESTGANLTFNILVTNKAGDYTYVNNNCVNTHYINPLSCPQGAVTIIVNASGYRQRVYSLTISSGMFYLLNAYLPSITPTGGDGGDGEDCSLLSFIDSTTAVTPVADATITLTHPLVSIVSVELFNKTLYGTYGGWVFVSTDMYTFNTTHVVVDMSVFDLNSTMVRVTYYYEYCVSNTELALYNLRVVESVQIGETSIDQPVEDAFVVIKKYINATGLYETITSFYTDANGYVNTWLAPNILYKVFINKSGYDDKISDYIPSPANEWGQTTEKIFRIVKTSSIPVVPAVYLFWDEIVFTGTMNSNDTLHVVFDDSLLNTTDSQVYVYEFYNGSLTLVNSTSWGAVFSYSYYVTGVNISRMHYVDLYLNHSCSFGENFNLQPVRLVVFPINYSIIRTQFDLEARIEALFGPGPLGSGSWCPFIICLIGLCVLASFGPFHVGAAIMVSGFSMGMLSVVFGIWLTNVFPVALTGIFGFIVVIGMLYILTRHPTEGL